VGAGRGQRAARAHHQRTRPRKCDVRRPEAKRADPAVGRTWLLPRVVAERDGYQGPTKIAPALRRPSAASSAPSNAARRARGDRSAAASARSRSAARRRGASSRTPIARRRRDLPDIASRASSTAPAGAVPGESRKEPWGRARPAPPGPRPDVGIHPRAGHDGDLARPATSRSGRSPRPRASQGRRCCRADDDLDLGMTRCRSHGGDACAPPSR